MLNFSIFEDFSELTEEKILKVNKYSKYLLMIFIAFFSAKIITNSIRIFANKYISSITPSSELNIETRRKVEPTATNLYEIIITRNIFNSINDIPDEERLSLTNTSGTDVVNRTTLPIELVGTIVLNEAELSVAAIKIEKNQVANSFVIGDVILSKAEIVNILRHRVLLKNIATGEIEFIDMDLEEEAKGSTVSTRSLSDSGIRIIDDQNVIMDRGELNKSLSNMNQLLMEARAIPFRKDGEMVGFKLLGIKPGSLYDRLGVKNGDVIMSVNGSDIKSPADAMKLYSLISSTNNFNFDILRGGENKNVRLEIR